MALAAIGCSERAEPAPSPSARVDPGPLPVAPFVMPKAWHSTYGDGPAVSPPDPDAEVWRALVNQHEPMQRETPTWQLVPPRETVHLTMPAGSRYRCIVQPLEVQAQPDESGAGLEQWLLSRSVLCSSDNFRTWTDHPHRVALRPDGSRAVVVQSDALLQERAEGAIRATYVEFRSDKEVRTAQRGEPRTLEGVKVVD